MICGSEYLCSAAVFHYHASAVFIKETAAFWDLNIAPCCDFDNKWINCAAPAKNERRATFLLLPPPADLPQPLCLRPNYLRRSSLHLWHFFLYLCLPCSYILIYPNSSTCVRTDLDEPSPPLRPSSWMKRHRKRKPIFNQDTQCNYLSFSLTYSRRYKTNTAVVHSSTTANQNAIVFQTQGTDRIPPSLRYSMCLCLISAFTQPL